MIVAKKAIYMIEGNGGYQLSFKTDIEKGRKKVHNQVGWDFLDHILSVFDYPFV